MEDTKILNNVWNEEKHEYNTVHGDQPALIRQIAIDYGIKCNSISLCPRGIEKHPKIKIHSPETFNYEIGQIHPWTDINNKLFIIHFMGCRDYLKISSFYNTLIK